MKEQNILSCCLERGMTEKESYQAYKIFFRTFNSEIRIKIMNALRRKKLNVQEIIKETGLEQTIVSHNLKKLSHCGFVEKEVKGKYRYYSLNKKTIEPILDSVNKHMSNHCIHIVRGER